MNNQKEYRDGYCPHGYAVAANCDICFAKRRGEAAPEPTTNFEQIGKELVERDENATCGPIVPCIEPSGANPATEGNHKHNWIGNVCSECGIAYEVFACKEIEATESLRAENERLKEDNGALAISLSRIEKCYQQCSDSQEELVREHDKEIDENVRLQSQLAAERKKREEAQLRANNLSEAVAALNKEPRPELVKLRELTADLRTRLEQAEHERDEAREALANHCGCTHDGRGELLSECDQHQQEREGCENLVMLLKKRFPQRPDGTLPDFAIKDVLTENDTLKARVVELEKAEKPFADMATALGDDLQDAHIIFPPRNLELLEVELRRGPNPTLQLTVGDLRQARQALGEKSAHHDAEAENMKPATEGNIERQREHQALGEKEGG